MDTTAQCPQGIENVKAVEKKARPIQKEQATNCPRCNSTNTKFCYYNNYSLSQPRYFCKACRRYWTEGGCLRNVPVGGGSRKNKRPSSSSSHQILSSKINKVINIPDNNNNNPPNPSKIQQGGHDLNLSYNPSHYNNNIGMSEFIALPFGLDSKNSQNPSFSNHIHPVMEFFKMGVPNSVYNNSNNSSGFPVLHDFKPFSVDGLENGYGNLQGAAQERDNNMIFPFGDLKQVQNSDQQFEQQDRGAQGDQANGFWNGMLAGGGSSW
ncbi:hypothetical protein CASFOL_023705 [Castilleja foliolosa]|uniref:Dof zinc finger protein n=1 Tax=Castilleja foliolosa TaxID=1961234 RepID=A0ABD3CN18_9LAMI